MVSDNCFLTPTSVCRIQKTVQKREVFKQPKNSDELYSCTVTVQFSDQKKLRHYAVVKINLSQSNCINQNEMTLYS